MDLDRIRELIIAFALVSLIAAAGAIALYDFQTNERSKHLTSVSNETIALTATTDTVTNETVTMDAANVTATLANNHVTTLSALRNITSNDLLGYCNITLSTGGLVCNTTTSNTIYADYIHNDYSTGSLAQSALYVSMSA